MNADGRSFRSCPTETYHLVRLSRERILLLVLLAATVAVWFLVWGEVNNDLRITVLDVGQGDCILVQAPGGRTMLVDGGGMHGQEASGYDIGHEVVVPALMVRGVRKIDVLVITHPHDDHVGGLPAVAEEMPVTLALDPMIESESEAYAALKKALQDGRVPVERVSEGARINLGRGIYADVLNPPEPLLLGGDSDENDNSVVLRLVDGDVTVLLAADIEEVGAARLAGYGEAIHSTILKVPHHGSAGAAQPGFLDAVRPELAVISVGANNPFGHPSDEMMRELERVGAKVMRTDRDGAITLTIRPPRWRAMGYAGTAQHRSAPMTADERGWQERPLLPSKR